MIILIYNDNGNDTENLVNIMATYKLDDVADNDHHGPAYYDDCQHHNCHQHCFHTDVLI